VFLGRQERSTTKVQEGLIVAFTSLAFNASVSQIGFHISCQSTCGSHRLDQFFLSFPKIPSAGDLATRLSLLCGKQFPVSSRKFPVQVRREFWRNQLTYRRKTEPSTRPSRLDLQNFPVFSLRSGNFDGARLVRCSLPAQPANRGFSGSLPTSGEWSGRSAEMRH
jgi:hypothetical protein